MATKNSINNKTSELTIDPGASGDSKLQLDINTVAKFCLGVDDDDGDKFKISSGGTLGSNDCVVIESTGEVTKPLQSAFLAVLDSNITSVTGDDTLYTVVWDTEVFDQNNDFDGTSTYTAPVTSKVEFSIGITVDNINVSHNIMYLKLVTSNRDYLCYQINPTAVDVSGVVGMSFSVLADMDASDTAYFQVNVSGSTKTVDLVSNGSTDPYNWFSGVILC